jgi:glycerol-3-phosphate dehydrogenase
MAVGGQLPADDREQAFDPPRRGEIVDDVPAGAITRRHIIHDFASAGGIEGLLSIIGGKLTTYRHLAEQTVDRVYAKLGRSVPRCPTRDAALPGAPEGESFVAFADRFAGASGFSERTAAHLVDVYGARAEEVLRIAEREPRLREAFCPHTGAIGAELVFAFQHEMAQSLGDALMRRTMAGLGPNLGLDVVEDAARIAGDALGWDAARREEEIALYQRETERFRPIGIEWPTSPGS